jgi:NSS family neurotransmitter:Na+ symporter
MIAHCLAALGDLMVGADSLADWLHGFRLPRNLLFMLLFMGLTIASFPRACATGIERWSSRLMPMLLMTLVMLVAYVLTLDGAARGCACT